MQKPDRGFWRQPAVPRTLGGLAVLLLMALPHLVNPFFVHSMILIIMYAALATAWNWLGGYAGQPSVGHAVFFGLGAYGTALGQTWYDLNPWVGALIGILVAVLFAAVIAFPTFRLKGHYFAIATIAVAEIVYAVFMNWEKAGGGVGLSLKIRESSLVNFQFAGKTGYYYLILAILGVGLVITYLLERSRPGYYFRAIKGDSDAARALGIDIFKYKMMAMLLSASLTALIGAYWANYVLFIDPDSGLSGSMSVQILLIAAVGGVGSLWGPVIGALILVPLSEATRALLGGQGAGAALMLYGGLIMLVSVLQPAGIMGAVQARRRAAQAARRTTTATEEVVRDAAAGS
jgi:branched-chain amino acid transport system permease protein